MDITHTPVKKHSRKNVCHLSDLSSAIAIHFFSTDFFNGALCDTHRSPPMGNPCCIRLYFTFCAWSAAITAPMAVA